MLAVFQSANLALIGCRSLTSPTLLLSHCLDPTRPRARRQLTVVLRAVRPGLLR